MVGGKVHPVTRIIVGGDNISFLNIWFLCTSDWNYLDFTCRSVE